MRYVSKWFLVAAVVAVAIGGLWGHACDARASSGAAGGGSKNGEDLEYRAWAAGWYRQAAKWVRIENRLRGYLGLRRTGLQEIIADSWLRYGRFYRTVARRHLHACRRLHDRILHPGGTGAARWLPLVKLVGWPRAQWGNCLYCIEHESGGNPHSYYPSSGAAGLFQFLPPFWRGKYDPCDPVWNVRRALQLWRVRGWQPWVVM